MEVNPIKKVCYVCGLVEPSPVHLLDVPDKHEYVSGLLSWDGPDTSRIHPNQTNIIDHLDAVNDYVDPNTVR